MKRGFSDLLDLSDDPEFFLAGYIGTILYIYLKARYYLHEMAEQDEDMKRKRILLTAREKQGIVNLCLERRNITKLFLLTFL
jgi:hypothetical protein